MIKYAPVCSIFLLICQVLSQEEKLYLDSDRNIQNLVVQISNKIQEYDNELIDRIKNQISFASKALFTATDNLAKSTPGIKFGKVFISFPSEWRFEKDNLIEKKFDRAHFKIVTKSENNNSDKPYTKQPKKCGVQGDYSRFTVDFFKVNKSNLANGKRIMKEFVQLRYGVFSEKPYKNILFVHNGSHLVKGICNQNIQWEVNHGSEKCSDKNSECKYKIKENQTHNYSIMFDTETNSSEYFCNDADRPHNSLAYNLQNMICKGKSITSIILKHEDFKQNIYKPSVYTKPYFEIVRRKGREIVFVLDFSGSMNEVVEKMKSMVETFLENTIESSAEVGIVTFNNKATVVSPLIKINTPDKRKFLIEKIKKINCYGFSNIAMGLKEGIKVIMANSKKPDEARTIILISDEENFDDNQLSYKTVLKTVSKSRLIFNVISFNNKSNSLLSKLTKETGGIYQNVKKKFFLAKILEKLKIGNTNKKEYNNSKQNKIILDSKSNKFNYKYNYTFLENIIIINVFVTKNLVKYNTTISNSFGLLIQPKTSTFKRKLSKLVFEIERSKAKSEKYWLNFEKKQKSKHHKRKDEIQSIQFSISGKQKKFNKRVINPSGMISKSFIEIVDEMSSVTITVDMSDCGITDDENVKINLEVKYPNNNDENIFEVMKDDGIGDDSVEGDKIFTKKLYSKDLLKKGFYTFIGHVEITNNKTLERIKRNVIFENLLVKDVSPSAETDKVPPAQMPEPTIRIISGNKIELKTIATGDDSMNGQISKYQISIRSEKTYIKNITKLVEPYEEIKFELDLDVAKPGTLIEIAIRGVDDNENAGDWSTAIPVQWKKLNI